jgi:hypothetical protein
MLYMLIMTAVLYVGGNTLTKLAWKQHTKNETNRRGEG